mmetsp:Transcript_10417/g.11464  ORF Transcript_10417/g.11464 Transcript_10417/m.11464 type:complete len:260 (-) Transcript_10417:45-824(-)
MRRNLKRSWEFSTPHQQVFVVSKRKKRKGVKICTKTNIVCLLLLSVLLYGYWTFLNNLSEDTTEEADNKKVSALRLKNTLQPTGGSMFTRNQDTVKAIKKPKSVKARKLIQQNKPKVCKNEIVVASAGALSGDKATFTSGKQKSVGKYGWNVVVYDSETFVVSHSLITVPNKALAQITKEMTAIIDEAPEGSIVAISVRGSPFQNKMRNPVKFQFLKSIGSEIPHLEFRSSYAAIWIKGKAIVAEEYDELKPVTISYCI